MNFHVSEKKKRVSVCLSTRVRRFRLNFFRFFLSKTIFTHIVPIFYMAGSHANHLLYAKLLHLDI
jgi:hypothetical protein